MGSVSRQRTRSSRHATPGRQGQPSASTTRCRLTRASRCISQAGPSIRARTPSAIWHRSQSSQHLPEWRDVRLVEGHAKLLQLALQVVIELADVLPLIVRCAIDIARHHLLQVLRQLLPGAKVGDQPEPIPHVVGLGDELLNFVKFPIVDDGQGVLFPVHQSGLQSGIRLVDVDGSPRRPSRRPAPASRPTRRGRRSCTTTRGLLRRTRPSPAAESRVAPIPPASTPARAGGEGTSTVDVTRQRRWYRTTGRIHDRLLGWLVFRHRRLAPSAREKGTGIFFSGTALRRCFAQKLDQSIFLFTEIFRVPRPRSTLPE